MFLDRDGTLINTRVEGGVPMPARSLAEMEILPGVPEALDELRRLGLWLVVFTNQPDVARGTLQRKDIEAMHAALQHSLCLDEILCCYHDDADGCACRKPRPGMLIDAAERLGLRLPLSFVVGDRWRDIGAGRAAGCTTILLRRAYSGDAVQPDFEVEDLVHAADVIVRCWKERQ